VDVSATWHVGDLPYSGYLLLLLLLLSDATVDVCVIDRSSARSSIMYEETERRRSSPEHESRRRSSRGLSLSRDAARRSSAASAGAGGGGGSLAVGGRYSMEWWPSDGGCEAPVSCVPRTCWCRCDHEIHDPALLDDCCGYAYQWRRQAGREGSFPAMGGRPEIM